jgi:hypothetical protein
VDTPFVNYSYGVSMRVIPLTFSANARSGGRSVPAWRD